MSGPSRVTWLRRGAVAAVALSGLLLTWSLERASEQRANRLHRAGASAAAAELFVARLGEGDSEAALRYNLGTVLLELSSATAMEELEAAVETGTGDVRARALYNSGLFHLRLALEGAEPDSLRAVAAAAVESNRSALLLRPEHEDTKWNLAMSQRLLDSIDAGSRRSGEETAESALEADEVVQSENVLEVDEENELPEDAPMQGEEETRADREDEAPLSLIEAEEILTDAHLDPPLMVRKLLALEGRSFFGRRLRRSGPRR